MYESKRDRKTCPICFRTILKQRSNAQIYCSDLCMRIARAERKKFRFHHRNKHRVRDVYAFAMWLAKQFYPFLLQYHAEDVQSTCTLIKYETETKGLKLVPAISRYAQRELYRFARELGWRRLKNGKWLASQ